MDLQNSLDYSEIFEIIIPSAHSLKGGGTTYYPPQIQEALETAILRRRHSVHKEVQEFTRKKKEEFRAWRERIRLQAQVIASMASLPISKTSENVPSRKPGTLNLSKPKPDVQNLNLFHKSPFTQHFHHEASPLAAVNLTRSYSERPASPSPPSSKVTSPTVPLSSSLKSPNSSNYPKRAKRVMFRDPPDVESQSDVEEESPFHETNICCPLPSEPSITVDGIRKPMDFWVNGR